jgi:hypothetical protein
MEYPESRILEVALNKLRADGWRIVCEVPISFRNVDAVAVKDNELIVIEAKVCFNRGLKSQTQTLLWRADYVLAVVGSKPVASTIDWCNQWKIGAWVVKNDSLTELVDMQKLEPHVYLKADLLKKVNMLAHSRAVGGLPNQKGVGLAQDVQREVDAYKLAHPKATWKEVFDNVPSHYDNYKNMYSALRSNAGRLAYRDRMKLYKQQRKEAV